MIPNLYVENDCFTKQPIYKWLFGVPGRYMSLSATLSPYLETFQFGVPYSFRRVWFCSQGWFFGTPAPTASKTRWFQRLFIFTPNWKWSNLTSVFSGLKQATRKLCTSFFQVNFLIPRNGGHCSTLERSQIKKTLKKVTNRRKLVVY